MFNVQRFQSELSRSHGTSLSLKKSFHLQARHKRIDCLTNSVKSALDAVRVSIAAAARKRE